jgi:plasmid replication initiation protein
MRLYRVNKGETSLNPAQRSRAMKTKNGEKNSVQVVQSNRLIEARYALTLGEARLLLAMIGKIKTTDNDFAEYSLQLTELAEIYDLDRINIYEETKKITKKLMSRVLQVEMENGDLMLFHWVCKAICKKGSVVLSFIPELKPYLLKLKREFTVFDIDAVKDFQSIYSLRLYQLLKQYLSIGYRELALEDLKEILGLNKGQYEQFHNFKARVLKQALKEFEAEESRCDITFKLETIKTGKKITHLKFFIYPREIAKKQEESKQPAQSQPLQPAIVHPTHKYFSRLPFDRYDDEFGQWLAEKRLIVDLQQWGESGYNSFMCRDSYNKFLKETGRE